MTLPIIVAHRGNSNYFVENSFEAIFTAIHNKVEYIEIDLRQTKDGQIIISHDNSLRRIFKKKGVISSLTHKEILDLCSDGTEVLTLDYIIKLLNGKTKFFFEIKNTCNEFLVLKKLEELNCKDYIIGSFFIEKLKNIRKQNRFVNLCHMSLIPKLDLISDFKKYNIKYVSIGDSFLFTKKTHQKYVDNNIKDIVFTINSLKKCNKYIKFGVFGITTDIPFEIADHYKKLNADSLLINNLKPQKKIITKN